VSTTQADVPDAHATDAHGDDGHGGHGEHEDEPLGPIDWPAWGAAVLGIVAALVAAGALYLSLNPG
jgi:hypothetical protein